MPTDRLKPGLKAEIVTAVDDNLVVKQGRGGAVHAIDDRLERARIEAVQAYLPEGHTTVGFEVNVKGTSAPRPKARR